MVDKTKLEELSQELPEQERKELLAKISKDQQKEEREGVIEVELKEEERERLISEEMEQIGGWERFILWLKSLFSGRSKRDLFLIMKLNQLRRSIKQRNPGLSGFETRDLTPKFARHVFDLYAATYPLQEICHLFTQDQEFRTGAAAYLVEAQYAEAKKSLEELISLEEMETIYEESGHEEEVKKQVLRRLNDYLHKIPDKIFNHLDEGMKPTLYLRSLISFPYSTLFRNFNYYPGDRLDDKYPYFDHAPAMLLLDQLERLYYAIYVALKLAKDWFCHAEFLRFFALHKREGESPDELTSQVVEQEVVGMTNAMEALVEASSQFNLKVPLLELIEYFKKDPYYHLIFNIPQLRLKALYATAFKDRLLAQFDEKMRQVKKNVVDKKIREVFKTEQLLELFYYNDKPSFDFRKLGLPFFGFTKSLMLVYNYLSRIYKGAIQEVIQLAGAYLLSNNRIVQNRIMQHASSLEELEAKIVLFDRSLSPDEDDGKTLIRYRHRIGTDLAQQKLYRSFIAQKDREAKELLDRGVESLNGIKKIFDELITSPVESVKSVLKTVHFHRGKNQTLLAILKYISEMISDFHQLLDQLVVIEKGS